MSRKTYSSREALFKGLAEYAPRRAAETASENPITTFRNYDRGQVAFVPESGTTGVPRTYTVREGNNWDIWPGPYGQQDHFDISKVFGKKKLWEVRTTRSGDQHPDILYAQFESGRGWRAVFRHYVDGNSPFRDANLTAEEHGAIGRVVEDTDLLRGVYRNFRLYEPGQLDDEFREYVERSDPDDAAGIWEAYQSLRQPDTQRTLGSETLMLAHVDHPPEAHWARGPAFGTY